MVICTKAMKSKRFFFKKKKIMEFEKPLIKIYYFARARVVTLRVKTLVAQTENLSLIPLPKIHARRRGPTP